MATVISRLQSEALSLCGLENILHGSNDLEARIINDANRAIQECSIFIDDRFHFEEKRGVYVRPKTTTTADVTLGATTLANLSGSATWMAGCSIQIAGSAVYNRIRKVGADYVLARPYLGSTGTGKAVTIWHDAVQLPSDVAAVKAPLFYGDKELVLSNSDDIRRFVGESTNRAGVPAYVATVAAKTGDAAIMLALMFDALPEGGSEVSFTASGLVANFADLNDTREAIMPFSMEASILLPIFRFHFAAYGGSQVSQQDLAMSYQIASQALERMPARSGVNTLKRPKR